MLFYLWCVPGQWPLQISLQLSTHVYTPEEEVDPGSLTPEPATPPVQRRRHTKAIPTGDGQKPKRVTTASLSTQLQQVMEALPQLTLQMQALGDKQMIFEDQLPTLGKSASVAVAQPLGQALDLPRHPMSGLAKAVPRPFRTVSFPTVSVELHALRRWRLWRPRGWTNLQDLPRSQEMHWPRLCWPSPRL